MLTIRKAEWSDVPALFQMISHYAAQRLVLPRTLVELYESVSEFTVAEQDGAIVGCGALKSYSGELAELRSLCVAPGGRNRGLGRALSERLLEEADSLGLKTVFALTLAPRFFTKLGFREVPRESFPVKVWGDCLACPKYFQCDEKALAFDLDGRRARKEEAALEPAAVASQG